MSLTTRMRFLQGMTLGILATFLPAMPCQAAGEIAEPLVEKRVKRLGPAPDMLPQTTAISPDGQRMAYLVKRRNLYVVVCDGKEGPALHAVSHPRFSPDSRRMAYLARQDTEAFVICDGQKGKSYTAFSTYHEREDKVSGLDYLGLQAGYFETFGPTFSPDSRHLAYGMRRLHVGVLIVCDGREGRVYGLVGKPVFSPDSQHLAYEAFDRRTKDADQSRLRRGDEDDNRFVVCDGTEGPRYWSLPDYMQWDQSPVFSPDSKRLAYAASREGGKKGFVVCDGKEGREYDGVARPVFSPDSQHLAYWAVRDTRPFIVHDGREGDVPAVDVHIEQRMHPLCFSSDSQQVAFVTMNADFTKCIVCGGRRGRNYKDLRCPMFSPGGQLVYFAVRERFVYARPDLDSARFIICDGKEGPVYDDTRPDWLTLASLGGPQWVLQEYPFFSDDGRHLFYRARRDDKYFMVCDGMEGPPHAWVWIPEQFDKVPGKLQYVVGDGKDVWLVETDWPPGRNWASGLVEPRD